MMKMCLTRIAPAALVLLMAMPAAAQTRRDMRDRPVTADDIQRLQDEVYDTGNEVSRLRSRDPERADRLQHQLDDLRDEVAYLKVKLQKEGSVSRDDVHDTGARIAELRDQTRAAPPPAAGGSNLSGGAYDPARPGPIHDNELPAGQALDVRLEQPLSSATAQVEDRFTVTTVVDLYQGDEVLVPAGSVLRGIVRSVTKTTRTDRKGALTVSFDQLTIHGRSYPIRASVTQAIESQGVQGEAGKVSAGAGVGAILGGILGGAKGALLGVLVGGGGTLAATDGDDVVLPAGTMLRVRFDEPALVR
jgi:hypothetical protein